MNPEIGAFEAKARLSAILREVEKGRSFTITVRGRPVADLVPSHQTDESNIESAIEKMLHIRKIRGVSNKNIQQWITAGRR